MNRNARLSYFLPSHISIFPRLRWHQAFAVFISTISLMIVWMCAICSSDRPQAFNACARNLTKGRRRTKIKKEAQPRKCVNISKCYGWSSLFGKSRQVERLRRLFFTLWTFQRESAITKRDSLPRRSRLSPKPKWFLLSLHALQNFIPHVSQRSVEIEEQPPTPSGPARAPMAAQFLVETG